MAWVDTASETFVARHDERDEEDAARVLAQLEFARTRLEERFDHAPRRARGRPALLGRPARRRAAVAAGRAPPHRARRAPLRRRLGRPARAARARAAAARAPRLQRRGLAGDADAGALGAARAPLRRRRPPEAAAAAQPPRVARWARWAWLVEGAAQWLSGQTRHVRPAVARRLREGPTPAFPPVARRRAAARRLDLRPARARGGRPRVRHAGARPAPRRAAARAGDRVPALGAPHRERVALTPAKARRVSGSAKRSSERPEQRTQPPRGSPSRRTGRRRPPRTSRHGQRQRHGQRAHPRRVALLRQATPLAAVAEDLAGGVQAGGRDEDVARARRRGSPARRSRPSGAPATGCPPRAAGPGRAPPRPGCAPRRRARAGPRRSPGGPCGRGWRARTSAASRAASACTSGSPQSSQKRSWAACGVAHDGHTSARLTPSPGARPARRCCRRSTTGAGRARGP